MSSISESEISETLSHSIGLQPLSYVTDDT